MIDPELLTKEAGFEDGVVVEIVDNFGSSVGYLNRITDTRVWIGDSHDNHGTQLSHIISIRPLTGAMSIWNHAPEWAGSVFITGNSVTWFKEVFETSPEGWGNRPFWARIGE